MSVTSISEPERATLRAVCEAFVPRLEPAAGDSPALFRLGAADVDLAAAVETAMGALSPHRRSELRLFLRLLESRAFMLVAASRFCGVSDLALGERERALQRMASHWLPQVRSGFQALRRLATFLFYSVTPAGAANSAAAALGYVAPEPPKPGPAAASLTLTRVDHATTIDADVCVVGSGAGGGVVAARLAAAGKTVVVLEAGNADQAADYSTREVVGMQRLYLDQGTTATRDVGVAILAGSALGGGTSVNWQTSLRTPDYIRDEWSERSGLRLFSDRVFGDALDAVCTRLSVGTGESAPNLNNAVLARGCAALGYAWSATPRNSRGCDAEYCGFCAFGCRVGGKQSTANTYLRDAQSTGRVTIIAACRAERVRIERRSASGVEAVARDESSGRNHEVRVNAPVVVVCAGAIETPALLLRSGIAHPALGRNLFLHPTTAVAGRYAERIDGWRGAPQTVVSTAFSRLAGNYGYHLETAPVHPGLIALAQPWYGARDHRTRMQHMGHVAAFIVLSRDRAGGRVSIDGDGRPVIDYRVAAAERTLLQHGITSAVRVHWAAGAEEIHTLHTRDQSLRRSVTSDIDAHCRRLQSLPVHDNHCGVFSAHQMGTCRMGADARAAVCDERGAVHGVRGLHVADASLFPLSSGVNPMITIMALAHVVADSMSS